MGKESNQSIEDLIGGLSNDLKPIKPLKNTALRIIPCMGTCVLYMALVVSWIGVRPDLMIKFSEVSFVFEITIMSAVWLSAALCASCLCFPDMRGHHWAPAVPITLFGVFLLWSTLRAFQEGVYMPEIHWDHCFVEGLLMGGVPGLAMTFSAWRGNTTQPLWMAAMTALSVSALGYVGLRVTCMVDTVGHSCIYHFIPYVVAGACLGMAARFVYRW